MSKLLEVALWSALALGTMTATAETTSTYAPSPANLASREWFQDAKFGMFIHWGVYSVLGSGEWVMNDRKIRASDYEKVPTFFNPVDYDPAEWVKIAKDAGVKYITITSRHHDGFAMFDTKASDWNIVQRTPYKRDVLKPLAEECRKQGIKLFFYYSHLDWHHPDYFPRGATGKDTGRPENGEWSRYVDYMHAQLRELLTNYGEVGGIWFDGWWDRPDADWQLEKTYKLIHDLQPQAIVGNNHHCAPKPGEDYQMWERDLPGQNSAGFSHGSEVGKLPLETCDTMNGSWGFNLTDHHYKSVDELVHYLVKAAGNNANFLLNVGPMPNGKIQPEFVERLHAVGDWTKRYGDSIYGTRGGPIAAQPWGVTTQKGDKVYAHIIDPKAVNDAGSTCTIAMPGLDRKITSARVFPDGPEVKCEVVDKHATLTLEKALLAAPDTVVVMECSGK